MIKSDFEAINITVKNSTRDKNFLLSDLKFSFNKNETISFFFNREDEKSAFLSIFNNSDFNYLGLFRVNNQIYSNLGKSISKISQFHKLDIFDDFDPDKRVIELLEKKVFNFQYSNILEVIRTNNKLEKHLRMLKIYKYKKIEYSYVRSINLVMKNAISMLKENLEILNENILKKNAINHAYEYFVLLHSRYLKRRINLVIDRNIMFMDLFFKEFKSENLNDENLYLKSIEFARKIEELEFQDKSLEKIKKQITSSFSTPESNPKKENNKDVLNVFILDLENKLNLYSKKIKSLDKKDKNNLMLWKRRIVVKTFIDYLKQEMKALSHIDEDKVMELYEELNHLYKRILMESDSELSMNLKSSTKSEMGLYIRNELSSLFESYIQKNEIKKRETLSLNSPNKENKKTKKAEINLSLTKMKIDGQDILDEIEWKKQSLFYNFNENLNNIVSLTNKELEKYKKNKEIYDNLLLDFLKIKNNYIHNSNLSSEQFNKLNDNLFANESVKYETIYKFIQSDSKAMEKLFTKQVYLMKNTKLTEISLISRYLILKSCKRFDLSIFDLLKRVGKIDIVFKRTISLLLAHLDGKEISIFENLFSDLSYEDAKKLSQSYNNSVKFSEKEWILIETNIKKSKDVSSKVFVVDNSKNIEYGKTEDVFDNPFYNSTKKAMGIEDADDEENETPKNLNETLDFSYENDYYLVEGEHIIYGRLENIYKSLNVIPKLCLRTVSAEMLSNFESKIIFDRENSQLEEINVPSFEEKEFLIVDVKG